MEDSNAKTSEKSDEMSDELRLMEAVKNGDRGEIRRLTSHKISIDSPDQNGMTALMHASYKGDTEVVEILIAHGADVNKKSNEHEYTPLMFSTLAGSEETTKLLLESGANPDAENKIKKTATMMGAFVGRHGCVSLINNYISKSVIEYYTRTQGLEKEPKLPPILAEPLQKFVNITNLHPVNVCNFIKEHIILLDNFASVEKTLDLIRDKLYKNDIREVVALKIHYFLCILQKCQKWRKDSDEKQDGITAFIKKLVKGQPKDGFQFVIQDFIRESIKTFPFQQSNLFGTFQASLLGPEKSKEINALSALTQSINGLQSANFSETCATCGRKEDVKKCGKCKVVDYCSRNCQELHWSTHKKRCAKLAQQLKDQETLLTVCNGDAGHEQDNNKNNAANNQSEACG